jgi:hypothetical protein
MHIYRTNRAQQTKPHVLLISASHQATLNTTCCLLKLLLNPTGELITVGCSTELQLVPIIWWTEAIHSSDAHGHLTHGGGLLTSPVHGGVRWPALTDAVKLFAGAVVHTAAAVFGAWSTGSLRAWEPALDQNAGTVCLLLRRRPYLHTPYQLLMQATITRLLPYAETKVCTKCFPN